MSAAAEKATEAGAPAPDLASIVRDAQDRLAHAARVGQLRDDPLYPMVEAVAVSLGAQLQLHEAGVEQMREARQPIDTAAIARLEKAAVTGADRRAAELANARTWQSILVIAAVWALTLAVATFAGLLWGQAAERGEVHETERRLMAAFADGPDAARTWATLMENNDLPAALARCRASLGFTDASGRHACSIPLYLEGPRVITPNPPR